MITAVGAANRADASGCVLTCGDETISFLWGRFDSPGTASFWVSQAARRNSFRDRVRAEVSSTSLQEQLVFCLLGGHGVTTEMAQATYAELCRRVDMHSSPSTALIESALQLPIQLRGRMVRYRFWRQRARRIAEALQSLKAEEAPSDPRELRDWLTTFPGVGMKTASWVVRNTTGSDDIAIIDIWVVRALTLAGVFPATWKLPRDYARYEQAFLSYAAAGGVSASVLDWCIWEMSRVLLPLMPAVPD